MTSPSFDAMMADQPKPHAGKSVQQLADDLAATPHGVLGTAGGRPIPAETPTPPEPEPSVEAPQGAEVADTDGSPSAVREAEAQLILRHTHLKENLPILEVRGAKAMSDLRLAKKEMADIVRVLAAHKRLREPVRRKRT